LVQKELNRLPDEILRRILARLAALESNPRPSDVKKLKGRNAWRIRVGDYRVIYEIHDRELLILVITVGHRREVYR
jgi:mRNA interferase RelE/StbE